MHDIYGVGNIAIFMYIAAVSYPSITWETAMFIYIIYSQKSKHFHGTCIVN